MKFYERLGGIVGIAAFFLYFSALTVVVLWGAWGSNAGVPKVTDVYGNEVDVPAYTEQEASGRAVYIREVCWHCHSQFVRPVMDEELRWGPVSQPGESTVDRPHLFGTRRIGPDLAREGWLRVDDWHIAHLIDPRSVVPLSVMPSFTWLFRHDEPLEDEINGLIARLDTDGDGVVSPKFDDTKVWPAEAATWLKSPRLDNSGVLAPAYRQREDGSDIRDKSYVDQWTEVPGGDGLLSDYDARPRPTQEALDLVAYLQRLGTAIGPWRRAIDAATPVRAQQLPMYGVKVKWKNSAGQEVESEVEDGRMPLRSREARRYGLAWEKATPEERAVVGDLRKEYDLLRKAWGERNPLWHRRLERGKELYVEHCAGCHGAEGRGNGPGAMHLLIRPRDFTLAQYRYRSTPVGNLPLDGDIYRSIFRGLWGSSMPSWRNLPDDQIWLLVDYVKQFQETQNGEPLGGDFDLHRRAVRIPPPPSVRNEADLEKRLKRGRAVWMALQCFNCHGSEGRGDGPGWNGTIKDDGGIMRPRDLKGRDGRDVPELRLRGGAAPHDIYRTIMSGLTGTGMKASKTDFDAAWAAAEKVDSLVAAKAPENEIAEARVLARRALMVPLDENLPGVTKDKDDKGNPVEYLDRVNPDDDWNLVFYVMSLLGLKPQLGR